MTATLTPAQQAQAKAHAALIERLHEAARKLPAEDRVHVLTRVAAFGEAVAKEEQDRIKTELCEYIMAYAKQHGWCETAEQALDGIFPEGWRTTHDGYTLGPDRIFRKDGFTRDGLDASGRDKDGFDGEGYDKDGLHRETRRNREGRDADGYDEAGYNKQGYNKDGLNADGKNAFRFDENGLDEYGLTADGRDKQGFDKDGWNGSNRNRQGIYKPTGKDDWGFGLDGLDDEGKSRYRFGPDGFDEEGYTYDGRDYNRRTRAQNARDGRQAASQWATR